MFTVYPIQTCSEARQLKGVGSFPKVASHIELAKNKKNSDISRGGGQYFSRGVPPQLVPPLAIRLASYHIMTKKEPSSFLFFQSSAYLNNEDSTKNSSIADLEVSL